MSTPIERIQCMENPRLAPADQALAPDRLDALVSHYDQRFGARPFAAAILMTEFFIDYLRALYQAFDGDITMAIVLGEIGQATSRRFTDAQRLDALDITKIDAAPSFGTARPCNALSASLASGIPRETVRRKVRGLAERGWITQVPGGWIATRTAGDHLGPGFNREQGRRLLETARRLVEVLGRD
jgi:hypothetical protein